MVFREFSEFETHSLQEAATVQPEAEGFRPYIASKGTPAVEAKVSKEFPMTEVCFGRFISISMMDHSNVEEHDAAFDGTHVHIVFMHQV
jgi:hypothetical protein